MKLFLALVWKDLNFQLSNRRKAGWILFNCREKFITKIVIHTLYNLPAVWGVHNGTSCSDFFSNIHSNIQGRGSAPCCLGGLGDPQWGLLQISLPYDSLYIENWYFCKFIRTTRISWTLTDLTTYTWHKLSEAVPSIIYIGRHLDVFYIGRQYRRYGEIIYLSDKNLVWDI